MTGRTHLITGVAVGAWYAAAIPAPDVIRLACVVIVAWAALFPDIDHHRGMITWTLPPITNLISWAVRRFTTHRAGLHRPEKAVPLAALGAVPAAVPAAVALGHLGWWWALALAVAVGWGTHLAADARTHSGLPIGRREHVTIGRTIRTGSPQESVFRKRWLHIAWVSCAAAWVLTTRGMPLAA